MLEGVAFPTPDGSTKMVVTIIAFERNTTTRRHDDHDPGHFALGRGEGDIVVLLGRIVRERLGFRQEDLDPELGRVVDLTLGAVREVRNTLGAGLLEEIDHLALYHGLEDLGLHVRSKVPLVVTYKGRPLGKGYEADLVVENKVTSELKAVDELHPRHEAQLPIDMRLVGTTVGFLVNFNAVPLGSGIKRKDL